MSPRDRDVSSDPAGHPAPLKAEGSRPLVMAAHATPALVLALGLISIGLLLWTCHESEQTAVDLVRVQNAVHGLELAVATSHLWLEEFLTGDPDVDIDEVWSDLDRALSLVLAVMQGGAPGLAGEPVTALKDPHLRESGEALKDRLIHLKSFSLERYQEHAGIGTAMDQEFDALFIGILDDSRRLSEGLRDLAARERRRSRLYLGLIIGVWLGLVIAAVGALTARDRRRRHAERILRQKEAELRQAQKLEAVGRLAGGLAHDISNYLGAIRGYCEVCRLHCGGDPAQVRRMDAAMDTASEASHLIRRLLSFSRMDLVQPRVVDMSGIVQSMEDLLRHLIGEETRLCTSCAPDLWPVRIDPSQLEQVVMNLVVNARDAMPDGGEIRIRTRNEVRNDERQVVLTVEDTGEGMTPEVRERIFEPFFTTRRAGGSSGLGLATVHGIMRQYQGLIEVDSEPGRGTVFEVVLPASRGPVIGKGARSDPRIPAPRRPAGVLLVEDNERMRAATAELLETLGHAVVVARDGAEALRILSEDPAGPDLLVCDVVMPEMSGPALLDQLRGRGYRLPCLFITGHADSTMFQHGLEPDLAVLAKPFTARDLADKINGILESPRSRPAPS